MPTERDDDRTGARRIVASAVQMEAIARNMVKNREQAADVYRTQREATPPSKERYSQGSFEHLVIGSNDSSYMIGSAKPMHPGGGKVRAAISELHAIRHLLDQNVELIVLGSDDDQMTAMVRTEPQPEHERFHLDLNVSLSGLDEYEATALKKLLTDNLRTLLDAARRQNAERRITQLIQAIAPEDPLADVELKVAENTVALRRDFLERVPVQTSAEVHEHAGFPGGNPSQTVLRWRKAGKIFGVTHGARDLYPTFQFGKDGRPLTIIAELLEILRRADDMEDWDIALWFAGDSGWLDGKTPIECLRSDPEGVKRAAEQEVLRDEH